jgi:hypothetical protein
MPSPQKITSTPPGVAENGTNPTLTASVMSNSSKNVGLSLSAQVSPPGCDELRREANSTQYGLPVAVLPSYRRTFSEIDPCLTAHFRERCD